MPRPRLKLRTNRDMNADQLKNKLSYYLSKGLSLKDSCTLVNVNKSLLANLRSDPEFDNLVMKSIAMNKETHLDIIKDAGMGGAWQASAWFLERKHPEEFGKQDIVKHEYTVKIKTLQQVLVKIINEELSDNPQAKFRIINKLRNYEFTGQDLMDSSFKPKAIESESFDLKEED